MPEPESAERLLAELADKVDEISSHPSWEAVFSSAAIHGVKYERPKFTDVMIRVRALLAGKEKS